MPTGRHGLAADVVASHQRDRLFAATVDLVADQGYRNASIDQIVKAARVGYVAFYDLYDGKEDCFLAAFDRIVAEATEAVAAAVAGEEAWPARLAAGLASLLDQIAAEPRRARIAMVAVHAAGPAAHTHFEAAVASALPPLRQGRALGAEATALADTLEEAVLGGLIWIVHERLVGDEPIDADALLSEAIQIALGPYLGEREAKRLATAALRRRAHRV